MKVIVAVGKLIALAGWAWGLSSFIVPTMVPAPDIGRMVCLGLLAVHVAEAAVFAKALSVEQGGSVGSHVWQLLVYGYFHVMGVRYQ
jgi:uncharacterized protein YhhL (DUF1145 family)